MNNTPRRLRTNMQMRKMVRETRMSPSALVHPIFIKEGSGIVEDISSMDSQKRYSVDKVSFYIEELLKNDVSSVILFGIPNEKDEIGSGAYAENGVIQRCVRELKKNFPTLLVMTDVCMCEYTSHGHCGIVVNDYVDNAKTLPYLSKIALSHAGAGADVIAPSDMMDGRVAAIRNTLDENGFYKTALMSYAVKYSSAFYSPFREAADSSPAFGDRKTYQMDYHNGREAIKEAILDVEEGVDMLMVKPALSYLDIIKSVKENVDIPVAAYSVSGEYAMIKAAAKAGLIDEYHVMCETTVSIFRAGADILFTYYSKEIANAIKRGDIG